MQDNKLNEIWDQIIDYNIATKEELELITNINGFNEDSLNSIIYARTGYHDIEQFQDYE